MPLSFELSQDRRWGNRRIKDPKGFAAQKNGLSAETPQARRVPRTRREAIRSAITSIRKELFPRLIRTQRIPTKLTGAKRTDKPLPSIAGTWPSPQRTRAVDQASQKDVLGEYNWGVGLNAMFEAHVATAASNGDRIQTPTGLVKVVGNGQPGMLCASASVAHRRWYENRYGISSLRQQTDSISSTLPMWPFWDGARWMSSRICMVGNWHRRGDLGRDWRFSGGPCGSGMRSVTLDSNILMAQQSGHIGSCNRYRVFFCRSDAGSDRFQTSAG